MHFYDFPIRDWGDISCEKRFGYICKRGEKINKNALLWLDIFNNKKKDSCDGVVW